MSIAAGSSTVQLTTLSMPASAVLDAPHSWPPFYSNYCRPLPLHRLPSVGGSQERASNIMALPLWTASRELFASAALCFDGLDGQHVAETEIHATSTAADECQEQLLDPKLIPLEDLASDAMLVRLLTDPAYNIRLVHGTYLHKMYLQGQRWPRRQEIDPEEFVTNADLQHWLKESPATRARIIAVSHVWETREHPDPLGHQLQILAEARLWPASRSWYFIDYMSIYQFYRGEEDNPQQQCFVRAMSQMHVLYSHEATYTYQISTLPRWVDVDAPTDAHVAVFFCPDPNEPCRGSVQLVPVWALMRNDTPYSQRGWCQAELQWSCMRSDSSRLIILDAHTPNQASMAPMPPEVFEQLVGNGSLKFTHRNDMEAVLQLQRSIFHTKALATQCLVLARLPFEQVLRLTSALHHYTSLKELSVRQSQFSTAAAEKLVEGLELVPCVEIIDLQANDINDEVAIPLAKLLIVCRNIKTLNLSLNCIGDDGAVAIAGALAGNMSLELLAMADNSIRCRGAVCLAGAIRSNVSLIELNLGSNFIGPEGASAWADLLGNADVSLTVKRLHLRSCALQATDLQALLDGTWRRAWMRGGDYPDIVGLGSFDGLQRRLLAVYVATYADESQHISKGCVLALYGFVLAQSLFFLLGFFAPMPTWGSLVSAVGIVAGISTRVCVAVIRYSFQLCWNWERRAFYTAITLLAVCISCFVAAAVSVLPETYLHLSQTGAAPLILLSFGLGFVALSWYCRCVCKVLCKEL